MGWLGLTLLVGWIKGGDNFVQCPGFRTLYSDFAKKGGILTAGCPCFCDIRG